jgi:putative spermidine/putrescine transport system permease protein
VTGRRLSLIVLLAPALTVLVPFFVVPLGVLARNSFYRDDPTALMVADLGVRNYVRIFTDTQYVTAFIHSAGIAAAVTAVTMVCGYPFAYYLVRWARRSRPLLRWIVYTPLIVSAIVRVFGWIIITSDSGLINTTLLAAHLVDQPVRILYNVGGVFIGLCHRYFPLMVLPMATAIAKIDPALLAASSGLGAGSARTFFRVAIPLSLPGIVAGAQLVFAAVLSDFVLPLLMGSTRFRMLAPAIFDEAIGNVSWASAASMAIVMLIVTALILAVTGYAFRRVAPWARAL